MKKLLLLAFLCLIVFVLSSCSSSDSDVSDNRKNVNIDSLVRAIKKDSLFDVKDVYYDKSDSNLKIAITNKDNVISEKNYSIKYFDNEYHTDSISSIDGVYLYSYNRNKTLKSGNYNKPLVYTSKRQSREIDAFVKDFCTSKECVVLTDKIKATMNNPDSYEPVKCDVEIDDGNILVNQVFRGTNAFGGVITNKIAVLVTPSGNIIKEIN